MTTTTLSIRKYVPKRWLDAIFPENDSSKHDSLFNFINNEYVSQKVYPPAELVFHAFDFCPPEDVKVVIVGQDPYHGPNQAHGLSFSVPDGIAIPPSLKNMIKEMGQDIGCGTPESGNLESWAKQGVLLLNSSLTVIEAKPGSHAKAGWQTLTDSVISYLSSNYTNVVFILWGSHAISKSDLIDEHKHLILTAPHPSPLSAYKGFFGCAHFSQTNAYLVESGKTPINWCLESPNLFSNV